MDQHLITAEDVEYAQQMARLNRKRKSEETTVGKLEADCIARNDSVCHESVCIEDQPTNDKIIDEKMYNNRPIIPKFRNQWLFDKICRLIGKITTSMHLLKGISMDKLVCNFRANLELDLMNKRWTEFGQHAQHTLYIINREATKLSHSSTERDMTAVWKSLHSLLHSTFLLLKNEDLNCTVDSSMASTSSISSTIEIDTSDMSGNGLSILNPELIKTKLIQLAYSRGSKKKESNRAAKISSASVNRPYVNIRHSESEVFVVQDSLSRKLKKRTYSLPEPSKSMPTVMDKPSDNQTFGSPEKVADIILEKLLVHAQATTTNPVSPSYSSDTETISSRSAENKIDNLSDRISKLTTSVIGTDEFLLELKNKCRTERPREEFDINELIRKANSLIDSFKEFDHFSKEMPGNCKENFNFSLGQSKYDVKFENDSNFFKLENRVKERREEFWGNLVQNNFMQHLQPKNFENKSAQTEQKENENTSDLQTYSSSFENETDKISEEVQTSNSTCNSSAV